MKIKEIKELSPKHSPVTQHMMAIEQHSKHQDLTISDLIKIFGEDGHYILIVFLVLPFLQPIPMFGLSTPFGILMGTVGLFAYFKKPPFVPQRWKQKKLNKETVNKIAETSEKFFKVIDKFLKPRLTIMFAGPFKSINTSLIVLNAILLALPIPLPFSNTLPAWVIFLQAVSHLHKDGAIVIISYIQALLCLSFFILIGYGASTGIEFIDQWLNAIY
jgi:hypothetical protein